MNSKHIFYLLIAVIAVLLMGFAGSIYFGNKVLVSQASKLTSLKTDDYVLREQQTALLQANKDLAKYAGLENIALSVVPQDKDEAKTVREIVKLAEGAGIKIASITFPSSTLGQVAPKKPASSANTDSSASKPAADASTNSAQKTVTPPVTQVQAVPGISGVYSMEITVASDQKNPIPYSELIKFLTQLEQNRRTAHVKSITVTPDSKNRSRVSFTLILNVYIKP